MQRMTNLSIEKLAPKPARYEVADPQQRCLRVVVQPTGAKSFAVRYRFHGRPRKLTFPLGVGLAAARKLAADSLFEVAQGRDPAAAKQREREEKRLAAGDTLEAVCAEFFRREGEKIRSTREWQRILDRLVFPALGKRQIGDIRRKDVIRLLDAVEDNSGPAQADITLSILRRIMGWHAIRDENFRTPIIKGMKRYTSRSRERILTDDEIRAVWRAAGNIEGPFGYYIKFVLLTAARRDEAAHLEWSEIHGATWELPASRNKTKVHLVRPLSAAALSQINNTPRIAGSAFVFSADGRRLGGLGRRKAELEQISGTSGWTIHDLRGTSRSLMSRAGVLSEHAARCLGHVIGGVEGVYDRHDYRDEMLIAYEKLSTLIASIVDPQRFCSPSSRDYLGVIADI
jgi:integrase